MLPARFVRPLGIKGAVNVNFALGKLITARTHCHQAPRRNFAFGLSYVFLSKQAHAGEQSYSPNIRYVSDTVEGPVTFGETPEKTDPRRPSYSYHRWRRHGARERLGVAGPWIPRHNFELVSSQGHRWGVCMGGCMEGRTNDGPVPGRARTNV